MASGPASETILFIGSLVAATAVVGALGLVTQDVSGGLRMRGHVMSAALQTDVAIINDPWNVNATPLTIYVKNTGEAVLTSSLTNLFLDGALSTSPAYDVLGSSDDATWRPGDVLQVVASDLSVSVGDHRVRIVTETGIQAELQFHQS